MRILCTERLKGLQKQKIYIEVFPLYILKMNILDNVKREVAGVIGALVIDEEGEIKFSNLPTDFNENLSYVSQAANLLVKNLESTRGYERILIEGEKGRVLITSSDSGALIFVTNDKVNLALFKIMVEKARTQLKISEIPTSELVAVSQEEGKSKTEEISPEVINEVIRQVKSKLAGFGGSAMAENVIRKHMSGEMRTREDLENFIRGVCSAEITQIFGLGVARDLERKLLEKIKGR